METNHKPATPLPWVAKINEQPMMSYSYHALPSEDQTQRSRMLATGPDDTRYYVHAANAYPKLVEALLSLSAIASVKVDDLPKLRAAQTLLRDLGEV